ncbi:MAG TPA: hypothetical protein VG273_00430 [Bryobacteraceae bacterium]|nr:hypothetical protein [Bryobacteraceae bacterium]
MPLQIKVDPAGLAAGTYTGTVTISAEGTAEAITVTATVSAGPVITSVQNAATPDGTFAPNSFITVYGSGFATGPNSWNPVTTLPTTLGGVTAKVNGKDAYISYAGTGQLNILAPPDTASGPITVQVTTAAGSATGTATLGAVAPAWFTYNINGPTWLAALFGNTATYVVPANTFGASIQTHSAKAGDYLQLYATGMGATNPPAPSGVVLLTTYPLDDLARVKLTIAGQPIPVLYAGLTAAGLYQVNIQVPAGLGTGELPIVMTVDGHPTQLGVTLNFQ